MIIRILATIMLIIAATIATLTIGVACVIAALLRLPDRKGWPYDFLPRAWSLFVLPLTGVRVVVHNPERATSDTPHIFMANHMSWFDVPTLSSFLPRAKFVAKAELFNIPVFGAAMRAVGMIPIRRQASKAAVGAYDEAARRIRAGNSVVVYPEGTRGTEYPIRPFKKGPFLLAIMAGAPIVPILIYGAREVMPRWTMIMTPGTIHVHLLEPVSVEGMEQQDRDRLAAEVRGRIAGALKELYGIDSPPEPSAGATAERPLMTGQTG